MVQDPLHTLVMGTGAVGAYFGAQLAQAGAPVTFVARGANLAALQRDGLRVESRDGVLRLDRVHAVGDPVDAPHPGLVLVCVKSYDTAAAAAALLPVTGPETILLSLQNGIDNEAILASALRLAPPMGALTQIGAELVSPGVVRHDSGGRIIFGERDGRRSERSERVADLFARTGVAHHESRHIAVMLWDKLAWNAAFNACTALSRRTVGALLAQPDGRALIVAAMREVVQVATANGVRLDPARVEPEIERSGAELGHLRTSMLQDRERGHRLEHEALNGAVIRAAAHHDVAVPVNRVLYALLAAVDAGRRSSVVGRQSVPGQGG